MTVLSEQGNAFCTLAQKEVGQQLSHAPGCLQQQNLSANLIQVHLRLSQQAWWCLPLHYAFGVQLSMLLAMPSRAVV